MKKGQELLHGFLGLAQNFRVGRSCHSKQFYLARFLITVMVSSLCPKTAIHPLCSIFSNGGHVFRQADLSDTIFAQFLHKYILKLYKIDDRSLLQ